MTGQEARQRIKRCRTITAARQLYRDIYAAAGASKELQLLAWLVQQEVSDYAGRDREQAKQTLTNIRRLPEYVKSETEAVEYTQLGLDPRY